MRTYKFTDETKTTASRSDGKISIPWGEEGPVGGGQIWREWEEDGKPIPADYVAPPPTKDQVNAERDRRTEAGVPFEIRGQMHVFDFNQMGKDNITGAATLAKFAILKGAQPGDYRWANPNTDFTWITQANEKVRMDAHETSALGDVAAGWTTKHIYIARAVKDMDPIPADYTDDKYWK